MRSRERIPNHVSKTDISDLENMVSILALLRTRAGVEIFAPVMPELCYRKILTKEKSGEVRCWYGDVCRVSGGCAEISD